jgi:hypothetical protein
MCDLFGYKIGFNVEGEEQHQTIPGACLSFVIFVWLAIVLRYTYTQFVYENLDRPLTTKDHENHFIETNEELLWKDDQLRFAIGFSSIHGFEEDPEQTSVNLGNYLVFKALLVNYKKMDYYDNN